MPILQIESSNTENRSIAGDAHLGRDRTDWQASYLPSEFVVPFVLSR